MTIFEFTDYKAYFSALLKKMPHRGYGQLKRVAEHLQVNSVIVSQVFRGTRDLSVEQALDLSDYLGHTPAETDYFLLLVRHARAGTHRLKAHLKKEIQKQQEASRDLKHRIPSEKNLTEEAKAIFYSNWYYSGIRLLTSIDGFETVDAIAQRLDMPRASVKRVVDFLLEQGLCVQKGASLQMGPKTTHLEASSELVGRHHANWRIKGLQNMDSLKENELFYTAPMTLSGETARWVRRELVDTIQKIVTEVRDSKSEQLSCLNIDWFDVER